MLTDQVDVPVPAKSDNADDKAEMSSTPREIWSNRAIRARSQTLPREKSFVLVADRRVEFRLTSVN